MPKDSAKAPSRSKFQHRAIFLKRGNIEIKHNNNWRELSNIGEINKPLRPILRPAKGGHGEELYRKPG